MSWKEEERMVLIGIGKALFWFMVLLTVSLIGLCAAAICVFLTLAFLGWIFVSVKNCFVPVPVAARDTTTVAEKIKSMVMMTAVYIVLAFVALGVFNMWIPEVKIPVVTPLLQGRY